MARSNSSSQTTKRTKGQDGRAAQSQPPAEPVWKRALLAVPRGMGAAVRSLTDGGKSVIVRGRSDGVRGRETLRVDAKGGLNRG